MSHSPSSNSTLDQSKRDQGGKLDLHADAGLLALREAGLLTEFEKHARPEGDALKLVSPTGKVLWNENNIPATIPEAGAEREDHRPEIDRVALRDILLGAVRHERICRGKGLQYVESVDSATYNLHFSDSVETGFDLVVGADGAWSKVRPLLTAEKPFYSGVTAIDLWALDVKTRSSWLSDYVGIGSCFIFDEGRAVFAQRNGGGSIRTYACVQQPETWIRDSGIDWSQQATARNELVQRYFNTCGVEIKRIILECRDELVPRPLYMLPVGIRWDAHPGVTLIGDAAHLMTPFAGSGVNAGMLDSLELANAIVACKDSWESGRDTEASSNLEEAIARYEIAMFERGEKFATKTFRQMQSSFKHDGSENMLKFMMEVRPDIARFATGVECIG